MANYDIPQYPTQRLRYFNNQFLIDQDFIDDDAVRLGHERAFLRSLCVAGVCEGLQVTYPAANLPPSISPGVAIDKVGRMIVIDQATSALARPDALADGDYFVHISFLETEDAKAAGQGASDFTRWKQTPVVNATAKSAALPDGAVILGNCTVQNKAFVGAGSTIGRQYSGLRLPGPNQNTAATLRNSGAADDLAVLAGSLTIRRNASGQIGPALTLLNGAGGTGAGGAIDFNGNDPGSGNDPMLRIQSLDAGNWSSHLTFSIKKSGANTNKLVECLRLTSDGLLKFPTDSTNKIVTSDKIVISDDGTDRYGIGLNTSNINLFCPKTASFSLRQGNYKGTEVFSVSGSGTVTFSGPVDKSLTIRRDVKGGLGPTLTLFDGSAGAGAGGAIDFNGYDPGTDDPTLRIRSLDDGNWSSHLTFSTKKPGAGTNTLVERLRLTSDGLLQFPTDSTNKIITSDKIVISDDGTDRYGIGLNTSNINLFCPKTASFSLRQNSSTGTEVFSVRGDGTAKFSGPIDGSLIIRRVGVYQLGPTLTLLNDSDGGNGAGAAIDFNNHNPGPNNDPALRIQSQEVGDQGDTNLLFLIKKSTANTNKLVERLRLTSDGLLKFPNEMKDKIVLWDGGATDRYGIGLNSDNINLFYPPTARFSLRQSSSTGTEAFTVDGTGNLTISGEIKSNGSFLRVKGAKSNGCYFGADPTDKGVLIGSDYDTDVTLYSSIQGFMHLVCRDVRAPSDARLKDNIEPITGALARVVRLCAVSFDWKANARQDGAPKQLGFVAQQVREVVPEAVVDSKGGPLSITYSTITALLVEAVKEQQKHIDELRAALTPAPVS